MSSGSYDYRLVALSVLIAVCASYAALDLSARIQAAGGRVRLAWLACGATAMGVGIWSMHYVGMLAFTLPVPVLYDWPTVLLSLIAAIFAAAVAFFAVSRQNMGRLRALAGGVVMGGGISTMHYTGMAAMRLPAVVSYDTALVTLSVAFAMAISLAAIWLTCMFREEDRRPASSKIAAAIVMGAAIPVMHYMGMAAAHFAPSSIVLNTAHAVSTSTLGIAGVSAVTLIVSGVAVLTAAVDRKFSAQRSRLDASERRYQSLVEGVKDYAIFMLTPNGHIASWNLGAERIEGYRADEIIGRHFSCLYLDEDARTNKPAQLLNHALEHGRVEDEGWQVRKDGARFWADVILTPLSDGVGRVQGFSAVLRDTTERKEAEESLRDLSGRLLRVRDEERRRIARELHDSTGQVIAALSMYLGPLESQVRNLGQDAVHRVKESLHLLDDLSREVRTLSHLLHPPLLDDLGLSSALRTYVEGFAERSNIQVLLDIAPDVGRLPPELETAVFRIVQECLTNVHRHSDSSFADVRISRCKDGIHLEIEDQGKGISPEKRREIESGARAGVGIRGMRERLRQFGGALLIRARPDGKGTSVVIDLPLQFSAAAPQPEPERQLKLR